MREILLAVPVLLPIVGGAGMLVLHLKDGRENKDRSLMLLTEGFVSNGFPSGVVSVVWKSYGTF